MAWDDNLVDEQQIAASHGEGHARLLAGPGTGKTRVLTRRVLYLVTEAGVPPEDIAALTFTRAAAAELRDRVASALEDHDELPHVSTVHAYALRNLLYNSDRLDVLPKPIRIADDWEERWIIYEDISEHLDATIDEVDDHFSDMETDYSTLLHDTPDAEADPAFIGAWNQHREIFGYTLRSELVYRLKRALEQVGDFELAPEPRYLLVDEFQDLNACEIEVMEAIGERGVHVYGAGDDDQSIYGFRDARPEGIRNYDQYFDPYRELDLETCHRCARNVIDLAEFVANLDPDRNDREFQPREDAPDGDVRLLNFGDQNFEAVGIARLCRYLYDSEGLDWDEVLILLRSDDEEVFSSLIADALRQSDIPVAVNSGSDLPIDTDSGRQIIAGLRLCLERNDSFAWRSIIQVRDNRLGAGSLFTVYRFADDQNLRYGQATREICDSDAMTPYMRPRLPGEVQAVDALVARLQHSLARPGMLRKEKDPDHSAQDFLMQLSRSINAEFGHLDQDERNDVMAFLALLGTESDVTSLSQLMEVLSSYGTAAEQERQEGAVNILTMHKAKGLTSPAVIIPAAEDEYLPGHAEGTDQEDDERRLLYVSLTRAKEYLYMTYCDIRDNNQQYRGRTPPRVQERRTLTRFLHDGPLRAEDGTQFTRELV